MASQPKSADLIFSTSAFEQATRLEQWRASMSDAYYSLDIIEDSEHALSAKISVTSLSSVNISDFRSTPAKGYRHRADIAKDVSEFFVFVFVTRGEMFFNQLARCDRLMPGQYVMLRSGEPYELSCLTPSRAITLQLPVELIEDRFKLAQLHCGARYQNNPTLLPMIQSVTRSISAIPANERRPLNKDLQKQALDLILLLLRSERLQTSGSTNSNTDGLLTRLIEHIETCYSDPELTARQAAGSLGISVSHLHRILSSHDMAFGKLLKRVRLARAYETLNSVEANGLKVNEIAFNSGFLDHSYFSRLFRETYGKRPGNVRKLLSD